MHVSPCSTHVKASFFSVHAPSVQHVRAPVQSAVARGGIADSSDGLVTANRPLPPSSGLLSHGLMVQGQKLHVHT